MFKDAKSDVSKKEPVAEAKADEAPVLKIEKAPVKVEKSL